MKIIILIFPFLCLLLAGCENPLGDSATESTFEDAHLPGIKPPQAMANVLITNKNVSGSSYLRAKTDSDDELTFQITQNPTKGTISLNATTGAFTYTPFNNQFGNDSFKFIVSNELQTSREAIMSIVIVNTFTAPVAANISVTPFSEDSQSSLITLNYQDVDGDLATSCTLSNLSNVTVSQACACDGSGVCTVKVTGTANYFGSGSFDYQVNAAGENSNTAAASFTINAVNDLPVISTITSNSTNEDVAHTFNFLISDIDNSLSCSSTNLSLVSANTSLVTSSVVWAGSPPTCSVTVTPVANAFGSVNLQVGVNDLSGTTTTDFSLTIHRLADDAVSATYPFNVASEALYDLDAGLEFVGGKVQLSGTSHYDSSATVFVGQSYVGTSWSSAQQSLVLGSGSGCDGTLTNCEDFSTDWTPQYSSLIAYWNFNGSGSIASAATVTAVSGPSAIAHNINGTGMTLASGKVRNSLSLDGVDDTIRIPDNNIFNFKDFTIGAWIKINGAANNDHRIISQQNGANYWLFHIKDNQLSFWSSLDGILGTVKGPILNNGQWHYVAISRDTVNDYVTYWIDGMSWGRVAITNNSAFNIAADVFIGSWAGASQFFPGEIDELSIWSTALNVSEISAIYQRQFPKYGGRFVSRVFDSGHASSTSWTDISWKSNLPYGKELPDFTTSTQNESTANYPDIPSNNLMQGNIGLWHFNETVSATAPSGKDYKDYSGNSSHGVRSGGFWPLPNGKRSNSTFLDGLDDFINFGNNSTLNVSGTFTISLWTKFYSLPTGYPQLIGKIGNFTGYGLSYNAATGKVMAVIGSNGTNWTVIDSVAPTLNVWQLHTASFDGTTLRIYTNGELTASAPANAPLTNSAFLVAGRNDAVPVAGWYFQGEIDEAGLWSRALSANEIAGLYHRSVNHLKYQVRTCDQSNCSDGTWRGPDGTHNTFFSELNNSSSGSAQINFSDFASLNLPAKRYFQYQVFLQSTHTTSAYLPKAREVLVGPTHYSLSESSVIPDSGLDFMTLAGFSESGVTCTAGTRYALSLNKTQWYYWNSSMWTLSNNSYNQSNSATQINANVSTFSSVVGSGTIYYKLILKSNGTSACSVDEVNISGAK